MKKAVVLLSGGLDSSTCLYVAKSKGHAITALSFNYKQKNLVELEYAKKMAESADVEEHLIFNLDLDQIGASALTSDIEVPKGGQLLGQPDHIPVTYVPARNLIFMSIASALAESRKTNIIYIGANVLDYSGYPDCRPSFFESFKSVFSEATKAGAGGGKLDICLPLIDKTKAQIIELGLSLGVPYELSWSCYDPEVNEFGESKPCGECDSCILRKKGFETVLSQGSGKKNNK